MGSERDSAAGGQFRVGLVGLGVWGVRLSSELRRNGLEVVCFPGRTAESISRAQAEAPELLLVDSIDQLIEDESIVAMAITTPPESHFTIALRGVEAGKHVLVEKPLATEPEHVEALVDAARHAEVVLLTGYSVAFHPVVRRIATLVSADNVVGLRSEKRKFGTFTSDVVSSLLVHDVAVAFLLMGPLSQYSIIEMLGPKRDPHVLTVAVQRADGTQGLLTVDRLAKESRRVLTVASESGLYRWDGGQVLETWDQTGKSLDLIYHSAVSALECEVRTFISRVNSSTTHPDWLEFEYGVAMLAARMRREVVT